MYNKKVSVVTTLFDSQDYINEFFMRIKQCIEKLTLNYEIIFVNDGSRDKSIDIALKLYYSNLESVKVIDLSRNFGHHKAIMTGLYYAKGDLIFLVDVDLEEKPELLEEFYNLIIKNPEYDVIYGVQRKRKGKWFERLTGTMFYLLFNKVSDIKVPQNFVTARLMTKKYVDQLIRYREQELFLGGIFSSVGFKQMGVPISKGTSGKSTYTLNKRFMLFLNSFTSFTDAPLKFIFGLGMAISFFSIIYIFFWLIKKLFFGINIVGYTTLIISIWFLSGLIIFSIGLVGLYLSKIFIEVKNRPYTIIKKIYSNDKNV